MIGDFINTVVAAPEPTGVQLLAAVGVLSAGINPENFLPMRGRYARCRTIE